MNWASRQRGVRLRPSEGTRQAGGAHHFPDLLTQLCRLRRGHGAAKLRLPVVAGGHGEGRRRTPPASCQAKAGQEQQPARRTWRAPHGCRLHGALQLAHHGTMEDHTSGGAQTEGEGLQLCGSRPRQHRRAPPPSAWCAAHVAARHAPSRPEPGFRAAQQAISLLASDCWTAPLLRKPPPWLTCAVRLAWPTSCCPGAALCGRRGDSGRWKRSSSCCAIRLGARSRGEVGEPHA